MSWSFDGTNDYVDLTVSAGITDYPDGVWSCCGWLKLNSNAGTDSKTVINTVSNDFPTSGACNCYIYNDSYGTAGDRGKIEVYAADDVDSHDVLPKSTTTPFTSNTNWTHIAFVRSGDTLTIYINGTSVGSDTDATFDGITPNQFIRFAGDFGLDANRFTNGYMSDWAYWDDKALSTTELTKLALGYTPDWFGTPSWYCSMQTGFTCDIGGLTVTNNGATLSTSVNPTRIPKEDWLIATSQIADTDLRVTFPSVTANPTGPQTFKTYLRRTYDGPINPAVDIYLYENGSSVRKIISAQSISSLVGEQVNAIWDASELTTASGANVECRVVGLHSGGALPTFVNKGTASDTNATSITPGYPASMQTDDYLFLVIGTTDTSNDNVTADLPSSWNVLAGTLVSGSTYKGVGSNVDGKIIIFYRTVPSGGLSGTLSVTVATPQTNEIVIGQMYAWRNVDTVNPFGTPSLQSGSGTTVSMPSLTTTIANSVAVAFFAVGSSTTAASSTGESGGDWTETVAEDATATGNDATVGCQHANMASTGTISGGSFTVTSGGWACQGIILQPKPISTVEIGALDWVSNVPAIVTFDYDETGRAVTYVSVLDHTEQADFEQLSKLVTVISEITKTEQVDFEVLSNLVTIVGSVTRTDLAKFHEICSYTATSILTITEQVDFELLGNLVTAVGVITETEQADFHLPNLLVTIVGVLTETNKRNSHEPDLLTTIVSQIDLTTIIHRFETASLTAIATITYTDLIKRYEQGKLVTAVGVLTETDQADFHLSVLATIVGVLTETDRADFIDTAAITIVSVTTMTERFSHLELFPFTIVGTLDHTEQADFELLAQSITAVGVITNTAIANREETGLSMTWAGQVTATDLFGAYEQVLATIVGVLSESDQADFHVTPLVTAVGVLTETDRADFTLSTSMTIVGVLTETDVASFNDTVSFIINAIITETDNHSTPGRYEELLKLVTIVSVLSAIDTFSGIEIDSFTITGVLESQSKVGITNQTSLTATAIISQQNQADFDEIVSTILVGQLAETDIAHFRQSPAFTLSGVLSQVSVLSASDSGSFTITSSLASTAVRHMFETVFETIVSVITGGDVTHYEYNEGGRTFTIISNITKTETFAGQESIPFTIILECQEQDTASFHDVRSVNITVLTDHISVANFHDLERSITVVAQIANIVYNILSYPLYSQVKSLQQGNVLESTRTSDIVDSVKLTGIVKYLWPN